MIEICPGTGVCIPVQTKEVIFSTVNNRKALVNKLIRAFFSYEDMMGVGSLEELPNSNKIIGAILGKPLEINQNVVKFVNRA